MTIRISVLTENSVGVNGVLAEWGWSVFVETDTHAFLLDTGPGISACHNAQLLGIDLRRVDKIVLSHSHFDHTGGLREILRLIGKKEIEIVAHPDIWSKRYNRKKNGDMYMGMPFQREELETYGARFNLTREPYPLLPKVMTCGEVPMNTEFEAKSTPAHGETGRYLIDATGQRIDTIADDLAVIVSGSEGLIVFLGCAHRGIVNTLRQVQQVSDEEKIHAVIGGAHLIAESDDRIEKTMAVLDELQIQKIGLCHCTGPRAVARMIARFGDRFIFCNAGTRHEFP